MHTVMNMEAAAIKTAWKLHKRLRSEIPEDPTIPFLGLPRTTTKYAIQKYMCTSLFTAKLIFTVFKTENH